MNIKERQISEKEVVIENIVIELPQAFISEYSKQADGRLHN